jgi:catechol 2,3-dioxygenase
MEEREMRNNETLDEFRMPAGTHIGQVRLQVADLDRALAFYRDLVGFWQVSQNGPTAILSATGEPPFHILLTERRGARRKPPHTTGLYHVAVRFPSRRALARVLHRLLANRWPFQGFADHRVSEALYLADPDGNGLELYVDRPRKDWPWKDDQVVMGTDPLDVEGLLAEVADDTSRWNGVDPGTDIGHVHLHVSDLAEAEAFYHGLLGLDVTQRGYPGALFLSAGGYHHHVGVNVWAGVGAPPPPPDAVGLSSFALQIPDAAVWEDLLLRLDAAGVSTSEKNDYEYAVSVPVTDPAGNGVELLVEKA